MPGQTSVAGSSGNAHVVGGPGIAFFPDPKEIAQRKKYKLSGTVVNSVTGEGLPRATVAVNNGLVTITDSGGNFVFDGLASGSYYVFAQKPGYFDTREGSMGGYFKAVELSSDSSITVKLSPEAVVFGTITDSDGLPVQRLPVQCAKLTTVEGRKQWEPAGSATTDEDGYYRMSGLRAGTYTVIAGPSQFPAIGAMAKTGRQLAGYSAAYYPGREDGTSGGASISAGQKLTVDLSVDAEPFYSVSGSLNGPAEAGAYLRLVSRGVAQRETPGTMARRDTGAFTFRMVAAGDYTLEARGQAEGKMWSASAPVHVAGDVSGLQVAISPTVTIPVSVQVQKSKASAEVVSGPMGFRSGMPVQVMLRASDERDQRMYASSYQRPNDNSTFSISNVEPGTYSVEVHPMGDFYVASASYGSTDLLREKLVVSQSASQYPINVVLRDDGGKVNGSITSDAHPASGFVLIVPEDGIPHLEQRAGMTGDFALRELRPGGYSLLAFDSITDLEYSNKDALEPYMSHATHVDVSANQETSVKLDLIRRSEAEGED